jgi:mannose-6-phosphate isomerase
MKSYPLFMKPHFRHGAETPWGGSALNELFGKILPDDITGESLEISALSGMESEVENGTLAGFPLSRALAEMNGADSAFPLLVKLLDARETLSVQVHPGDEYARIHEGKAGKTEAWIVLAAKAGAKIIYGVKPEMADRFAEMTKRGDIGLALNIVPVHVGDVFYIPNGLVHALCGGAVVYEIQQSSDVTYGIWDWGRLASDGKPRELHIDHALSVSRPELSLSKITGTAVSVEGGAQITYIEDEHFELNKIMLSGVMPLPAGRMRLITSLGMCRLLWDEGEADFTPGKSCLIPANTEGAALSGQAELICAMPPASSLS